MEKKLGAVFAILAAAAAIFAGASKGVPAVETVVRAGLAAAAGGLVGWLVFGKLGAALMKEAAGKEEETPEKKD